MTTAELVEICDGIVDQDASTEHILQEIQDVIEVYVPNKAKLFDIATNVMVELIFND